MFPYSNDVDYQCWLNYQRLETPSLYDQYKEYFKNIVISIDGYIIDSIKNELYYSIKKFFNIEAIITNKPIKRTFTIISELEGGSFFNNTIKEEEYTSLNEEGFLIKKVENSTKKFILIAAKSDRGLLYGTYKLIQNIQMGKTLDQLKLLENPYVPLRIINHWDNLEGTIERGYAGKSFICGGPKNKSNT
ncbi:MULTISPECIES: alpha-glucuronidase family glycosyl hydrolase [Petrotoga]|jgi:alpha-glucuronidase|uniref:Alpha glucuronidase N-terminal domain-containing protein n=2 Tax=Petrotoga olearia TaxID=156203 RepID=A0A2K1NXB0_9BACT|nr:MULTISPECIES: alpha-glucuronidase family glycosyl hydrolase [Petrotoga]PNR95181.1 hypothetical protein X929_09595 [Petrotoga olearia DSM 13574]RMA72870.1 glycosyl hydrolase family 67 [Petrotoga olearia]